jgi:thioredoxin-related protein
VEKVMKAALISLFIICFCCMDEELPQLTFATINGDTIHFVPQKKTLILLVNLNGCHQCFEELNVLLKKDLQDKNNDVTVIGLIRAGNSIASRRIVLNEYKELFPNIRNFYFDFQENDDDYVKKIVNGGIFGKYDVINVPALILADKKTIKYIPYSELFHEGVLTARSRKRINDFLQ